MSEFSTDKLLQNMRNEIKGRIRMRGYTFETLAQKMTEMFNEKHTQQEINNKLSRGTIKYIDVIKIAVALGYKINWSWANKP